MKRKICLLVVFTFYVVLFSYLFSQNVKSLSTDMSFFSCSSDTSWVDSVTAVWKGAVYGFYPTPHRGVGTQGSYMVYLPREYSVSNRRYPVIYYLHSAQGSQREAAWLMEAVDLGIEEGKIPPVIVVCPQALSVGWYSNSFTGDTGRCNRPIEDVLVNDFVPYVDKTYRTIVSKCARGIEGYGMGGYGALRLGLKYPELFGYVSCISADLYKIVNDTLLNVVRDGYGVEKWDCSQERIAYFNDLYPDNSIDANASVLKRGTRVQFIVGSDDTVAQDNGVYRNIALLQAHLSLYGISNRMVEIPEAGHNLLPMIVYKRSLYPLGFWRKAFEDL